MPSVTIDGGVLAAPHLESTSDDVRKYIETLLDWKRLLDEPWVAIYMSERATELLFEDNLYPLRGALRHLFAAKGVIEYDANTVAQVADRLLQLTPSFETFFKVRDVLCSEIATAPELLSIHASHSLVSDLARCVVLIAVLRSHCRNPIMDHMMVVRPWNGAVVVQVRALIHDFDHSRDDMEKLPAPPEYFEGSVLVCQNFRELVQSIDEKAVWQTAQDDLGLTLAVQIALYKSRIDRGSDPAWENTESFSLGRRFFEMSKACCRVNAPSFIDRLLKSMVETIDHLSLSHTHALRTGNAGNAPQQYRGKDKAMRRDIDYEYHLHYWECQRGVIEFACVVPHYDFSIPE